MNNKEFSLVKVSTVVVAMSLVVKLFSYIKDIFIATRFGASANSDIFIQGITIITLFSTLILSPFSTAYTPYATENAITVDNKSRFFYGRIYKNVVCIVLLEFVFFLIFKKLGVKLLAPGFKDESSELLLKMLTLAAPIIIFQGLCIIGSVNLKAFNKFAYAEILAVIPYFAEVLYLLLCKDITIYGLAASYVLGFLIFMGVQYIIIHHDLQPKFPMGFLDENVRNIYKATGALLLSSTARQINTSVNSAIASLLPVGSITVISYASKIAIMEFQVISSSISSIVLVKMAQNVAMKRNEENKKLFLEAFNMTNSFVLPLAVLTAVLAKEIISFLFYRGAFSYQSVVDTADVMRCYAVGMTAHGMQDILVLSMYAYKETKYAVRSSLILVISNITLSLLLYRSLGTHGIALAEVISVTVIIPYLLIIFKNKIINYSLKSLVKDFGKVGIASLACGVTGYYVRMWMISISNSLLNVMILTCVVSIAVYIFISLIVKNLFFVRIWEKVRKK